MVVKSIGYSQSRESVSSIGLKSWNKVSMEAELNDGDIYQECFNELKKEVETALSSNPQSSEWTVTLGHGQITTPTQTFPIPVINKEAERIEIAIDNCKSLEDLNQYLNDSIKYNLVAQFLQKKKSFQ